MCFDHHIGDGAVGIGRGLDVDPVVAAEDGLVQLFGNKGLFVLVLIVFRQFPAFLREFDDALVLLAEFLLRNFRHGILFRQGRRRQE